MALGDPICNRASFRLEARFQRVCACCGKTGGFHAHHVVDKATLVKHGRSGNALYDTRNALRLCEGLDTARCHMNFENRGVIVTTKMLTDDNIAYAYEVLGDYAYDYLRAEYDDSDPDPRISARLEFNRAV